MKFSIFIAEKVSSLLHGQVFVNVYFRLPPDLVKKKPKIIYVIRNYKDITVSLYNFMSVMKHYNYDGSWVDWLELHLDEKCKKIYVEQTVTLTSFFMYNKVIEMINLGITMMTI